MTSGVLPQIPEGIKQAILAQRAKQGMLPPADGTSPMNPTAPAMPDPNAGPSVGHDALRAAMMPAPAPPMPAAPPTGVPAMPAPPAPGVQPGLQQPPPATDDPTVAMPQLPKPPEMTNSPLEMLLKRHQQTQDQLAAIPKPDPAQLKPKLWERFAGIALGMTQLRNPENAGAVAGQVVNRRFNNATRDYQAKTSPLYDQLKSENEGLGAAEAAGKIPQQDFNNKMEVAKEGRAQIETTAHSRFNSERAKANSGKFIAGSEQEDETSPTGWTAETVDGDRKPFTPKDYTKKAKVFSRYEEAESAASAEKDPAEKKRLTELAADLYRKHLRDVNTEHPGKEGKGTKEDPNGYSASEDREIKRRTSGAERELAAIAQHRAELTGMSGFVKPIKGKDGSTTDMVGDQIKKLDQRAAELSKQIDSIHDEVTGRRKGGGPAPTAAPTPGKAKPPNPALWKGKEGKPLTLKDKATGKTTTWRLVDGIPTMAGGA